MSSFDRRSFIKTSCLVACAGTLSSPGAVAATLSSRFTRTLSGPLPLAPAEETVLAFVKKYSSSVRFVGLGVLLKLRGGETSESHLLVEISDVAAFDAALAGPLPFSIGFADGNSLSFVLGDVEFTVENLTPEAFAQRLTDLVTVKRIAFAQDGLSYDPATLQLTDSFGAEKSASLKMVNATIAGGAAIGVAVRGRLEAGRLGMKNGGVFALWQARHLALGASAKTAQAIAETFLSKLATISESTTPEVVKTLLRSRAVSTALNRVFGLKVADVIANFDRLRPEISGEFSNAALWLALLLGPELESEAVDGAATTWLQHGTRFENLFSKKVLVAARQLVSLPSFPRN